MATWPFAIWLSLWAQHTSEEFYGNQTYVLLPGTAYDAQKRGNFGLRVEASTPESNGFPAAAIATVCSTEWFKSMRWISRIHDMAVKEKGRKMKKKIKNSGTVVRVYSNDRYILRCYHRRFMQCAAVAACWLWPLLEHGIHVLEGSCWQKQHQRLQQGLRLFVDRRLVLRRLHDEHTCLVLCGGK